MAKSGDLKITQSGEGGVAQAIAAQLQMITQGAMVALATEAAIIMADAKRRCPVSDHKDTGHKGEPHLRDTATVTQIQAGAKMGMFRVAFNAPYARFAHYRKYGGTAKWKVVRRKGQPLKRVLKSGYVGAEIRHSNGERLFLQHAMEYARHGMVSRVADGAKVS